MFKTTARLATLLAAASGLALATPALAHDTKHNHNHGHDHGSTPNIVETAAANADFETLVAAVQAADLVGALSGDGPFTVFAPTDPAFDALPAGTVQTLLRPENKAALTSVLTYHVVAGRVTAADLTRLIRDGNGHARIETLAGETLVARINNGQIVLTDAADRQVLVTAADIATSNGVIHVLDRVLLPA